MKVRKLKKLAQEKLGFPDKETFRKALDWINKENRFTYIRFSITRYKYHHWKGYGCKMKNKK